MRPSVIAAWLVAVVVIVVGAAFAGAACGSKPPPTYHNRTKAIFDTKCAGCHRDGGIGPMPLTSYDEIKAFKDIVPQAIASGQMPPWLAVDGCNDYANDFSLNAEEKADVATWFADGMPLGGEASSASQALTGPVDPSVAPIRYDDIFDAAPAPYTPQYNDEYRCYAIPWPYQGEKFITGFDMIPGDPTNVHHVNIFLNPPPSTSDPTSDFVATDARDPEAGWDCSGGDRVLASALVGAWAPGASGTSYPSGTGQLVVPGSQITLEVHYAHGVGALPDASQLALQLADTVQQRGLGTAFYKFGDWPDGGMNIPAGDADVTHDLEVDPSLQLAIVAPWMTARTIDVFVAALHMHSLGHTGELAIHGDDGVDQCLLKIDDWDYHWQMGYELRAPAKIVLGHDKLYLRCNWDNSSGERDVNWGDRVSDEMCIGFLYLVPEQ